MLLSFILYRTQPTITLKIIFIVPNFVCFFFNDTATTVIYTYLHTLSRHDALPISGAGSSLTQADVSSPAASSSAWRQQRVRKRQPDGGSAGEGTSPCRMIRSRLFSRRGSGSGTADSRACVYGCQALP